MNILELYESGVIDYLHKKGLLSSSTITYIEYYQRFLDERKKGSGYRETVRKLSREFNVSETTIKKAIRVIKNGEYKDGSGSMPAESSSRANSKQSIAL